MGALLAAILVLLALDFVVLWRAAAAVAPATAGQMDEAARVQRVAPTGFHLTSASFLVSVRDPAKGNGEFDLVVGLAPDGRLNIMNDTVRWK
jgi:hypothetical protein